MAVLNAWQKLDRVLTGLPFGDAADGNLTISSNASQSMPNASCSGSSGGTSLTLGAASTFANGDVVLIHQSRGTGVGQWEINKIVSGGGTTSLTLDKTLQYTYTDSGASQAQIIKVPRYNVLTINTGITWSVPNWDQNIGGIMTFAAKSLVVSGTGQLAIAGAAAPATTSPATTGGFHGGTGRATTSGTANQGEGTSGAGSQSGSANGNGGGGAFNSGGGNRASGGGGGNGTAGTNGQTGSGTGGTGGSTAGSADLTNSVFGGGGGGGSSGDNQGGGGSSGGGALFAFCKDVSLSNSAGVRVNLDGGASTAIGTTRNGGAGAGGSALFVVATGTFDTSKVSANGGAGISGGNTGGSGRIAIHHSGTITGTTSPTFTDTTDTSLVEVAGPANVKSKNGLAIASIKSFNGLSTGSVKSANGLA